jgi:hypothetical protein
MTDTATEQTREEKVAAHNNSLRGEKLKKKIQRQHDWRVQVWAQCELRIREAQAELEALGLDPIQTFDPQFDDEEMLRHYAEMSLTNR